MTTVESPIARFVSGRSFGLLIDGEVTESADGIVSTTLDPSTGAVLTSVPEASRQDVDRAIESAKRAQPAWGKLDLQARSRCFERFGELLDEHLEELAMLDAIDAGMPVRAMRDDVRLAFQYLDGWPRLAANVTGRSQTDGARALHVTAHQPYGVVGKICAFNHPAMFAITRPLPALITGNTVVMKAAPQTPLSALRLGELFGEAFPPGVVNVISGGVEAGDALVTHPDVKRIGFTGSVPTGLTIQRRAAESGHVKHVSLELGGKNAMIVLPDVDVDAAAAGAAFGMNFTVCQGQSCGSNSRVLVHRSIYDDFVARAESLMRSYTVAPAYEERADMGPLVSAEHLERVMGYVASGVDEGAELVTGGNAPPEVPPGGCFLNPTLFAGVHPGMRIAREEIFGPVMSVMAWDDLDDAVALANELPFGLTASVWTNDFHLAHGVAERLDAGYVWVNDSTRHYFGTPFGGTKDSGIGREESIEELYSHLETTVTHFRFQELEDARERLAV